MNGYHSTCPSCGQPTLTRQGMCFFCRNPECDIKGCDF